MIDELNIDVNDILENDVSAEIEPDKFPCPEKYSFIVDFHTLIDDGSTRPPIKEVIRKFQRNMDVLLGPGNSRFINIVHFSRTNETKVVPDNIVVSDDFVVTLRKYGHFILEFNIDTNDPLIFIYFVKELIDFCEYYHCNIDIRTEELNLFSFEPTMWLIKKQHNIILNGIRDVLSYENNPSINIFDIFGMYAMFINGSKDRLNSKLSADVAFERLSKLQISQRHNRKRKILTEDGETFI